MEFEQHPGETLDYTANFAFHCGRWREPATDYLVGTRVLPLAETGFQYNCTTAGRTRRGHLYERQWPTTIGGTVRDGSVTWTCEAITTASQTRTLSTAAFTSTTGIAIGAPTTSGTKSTVLIVGGTLGQDYDVTCTGTCSDGTVAVLSFKVKIRNPPRVVS